MKGISFHNYFPSPEHVRSRKIKFSRRSCSQASGKSSQSKKSSSLSSARRARLQESLRGKRVGNFLYNGPRKGNSLKWVKADSAWTHLLPVHLLLYLYIRGGPAGSEVNGRNVRARLDWRFGLPSIELFRYTCMRAKSMKLAR